MSAPVFWATVLGHEVLTGNAFIWVVTDSNRMPVELWPVEPNRVQVGRHPDTNNKVYLIDGVVPQADFFGPQQGNIMHVMGLSLDGLRGLSPIAKGNQSMALGLAAERAATSSMTSGSTPGGILSTEQVLSQEEAKAASEGWEQMHGGPAKAGKIAVFGKGTKWLQTQMNPDDAQLIETRKFQVSEVERWFGIPPHLMFDADKTTTWGAGIAE